jgi:hypothetical protein
VAGAVVAAGAAAEEEAAVAGAVEGAGDKRKEL